jgi:hypothetical protein
LGHSTQPSHCTAERHSFRTRHHLCVCSVQGRPGVSLCHAAATNHAATWKYEQVDARPVLGLIWESGIHGWFLREPSIMSSAITRLYLPITRLNCKLHDILSNYATLFVGLIWFLQLESCNSGSANPHGCVGRSGLHDIYPADDSADLMINESPVSVETGRSVSQIEASARIRRITNESGDFGINLGFGK